MSEQCKFKCYTWELPVRWCHWINAMCIVILSVTGLFIGNPYSIGRSASDFSMGWIRFIHFTAAYLFTVSVAARIVWSIIGNEYAGWRAFFPIFYAKGRKKLVKMLRYYLLLDHQVPETIGHNPLATSVYTTLFCLYIAMILTGFSLYALHAPDGMMYKSLGFMYHLFSNQGMRLFHHIGMWF